MADKIEISTHELCEFTSKSLNRKYSTEQVATVWHEIGNVIKAQMLQRKGVRLTSFGTFTFCKGNPVFSLANDMQKQFKLTFRQPLTIDNIPTTAINFAQVQAKTSIPRDVVEKIYSKFLTGIGRMIFEGRNILLTVNRVAELSFENYEVKAEFMPDFLKLFQTDDSQKAKTLDDFRNIAKKTTQTLTIQQDMLAFNERQFDQAASSPIQTGLNIGGETNEGFGRRNRANSARRDRNPITGEGMSELSGNNRPKSAGRLAVNPKELRRPNSARSDYSHPSISTTSLLHSPRSQASFGVARNARPSSAPRARPSSNNNGNNNLDPRRIAAKALASKPEDIVDKVRKKIVERGGSNGIRSISKLLAIMDNNGDHRLSKDEFYYGLRDYGINLNPTELEQVFLYFDRDGNGFIDITEFLVGIKGDLSPRRKKMVQMAFNLLDKDGSGAISVDEMLSVYDLTWHPEVRAGKLTVKEAAKEFMATWEKGQNKDGNITFEEFEDYYKEVSASIDDDNYFELMIRNAWRIAGGEGAAANTANRRILVTNKDGSQAVKTVENELGMRDWKDQNEVRRRLGQNQYDKVNMDDVDRMDMHGSYEDMKNAKRTRPQGANQPQRQQQQQRPSNPGNNGGRPSNQARGQPQQQRREAWAEENPRGRGGRGSEPNDFPFAAGGDQNLPPSRGSGAHNQSARELQRPMTATTTSYDILHRLLYTPPVNIELLCGKLQISSVTTTPRMPQGAFYKRLQQLDGNLTKEQLVTIYKLLDPKNLGYVDLNELHELLASRYGKDKTANKNMGVIERVIKKILERCGENAGIKGLSKTLMIMDNSGDKKLSKEEFKYGLEDYGVPLNIRELDEVFNYFDRDKSGTVDIDEFLIGIKGDLNERRKKFVRMAFNILDTDGSGEITVDEMMAKYDFRSHPEVLAGRKTIKEAAREFMAFWERDGNDLISYEEFEDYYKGVSASIDKDDYFELMIRNAWRIAGGEGAAANTANRRILVTNKDGSQAVKTVENELGMRDWKDQNEVRRRLGQNQYDKVNMDDVDRMDMHGSYEEKNSRYQNDRAKARTTQLDNRFQPRQQQRAGTPTNNRRPTSANQMQRNPSARLNSTAPPGAGGRYNPNANHHHQQQQQQEQREPTAFEKHVAATKLAAAYRARKARKVVEHEKRKLQATNQRRYEEEQEESRPKPREIIRPKGKSYIGF